MNKMNITKKLSLVFVLIFSLSALYAQKKLPALIGDGITDDTPAIQALLDSRASVVYLPAPKKHYVISKALRIYSNQTLKLDVTTLIRRANHSNDYMVTNADFDKGNQYVAVIGGIWDGNNLNNDRAMGRNGGVDGEGLREGKHPRTFFVGHTMLFMYVEHLSIEKSKIKDPTKWGICISGCRKFTVDDITFDYTLPGWAGWTGPADMAPSNTANMDGVHVLGPSSEGRIRNLKGNTFDDMVALGADDREYEEISEGPITDIQIDGLWGANCFRAVRLLSAEHPIKRISISNIFGSFYMGIIGFTHYILPTNENCLMEDISINNVFTAKYIEQGLAGKVGREEERKTHALFDFQEGTKVDNLSISNVFRNEWMPGAGPTIHIRRGVKVGTIQLNNIQQKNHTDTPLPLIQNDESIFRLYMNNVMVREKTGTDKAVPMKGEGKIENKHGEIFIESGQDFEEHNKKVDENFKNNPPKEKFLL
jgi:hypothetical protein